MSRKPRRAYSRRKVVVTDNVAIEEQSTVVANEEQFTGVGGSSIENVEQTEEQTASVCTVENVGGEDHQSVQKSVEDSKPTPIRKVFTENEEDLIVEFYKNHRFLWDPTHENYKIGVKSASLQQLVQQLGNKFSGICSPSLFLFQNHQL